MARLFPLIPAKCTGGLISAREKLQSGKCGVFRTTYLMSRTQNGSTLPEPTQKLRKKLYDMSYKKINCLFSAAVPASILIRLSGAFLFPKFLPTQNCENNWAKNRRHSFLPYLRNWTRGGQEK